MMMLMALLWSVTLLGVVIPAAVADITRIASLSSGSCLCADGTGINVRRTACGSAISQVSPGRCFKYQGEKIDCRLGGVSYTFYKVQYGSDSAWIAGQYLALGSASQCPNSQPQTQAPSVGGSCPRIVTRSQWGARRPRSTTNIRRPVPKVFIHHTESPTCWTQRDCASRVRGFQNYHMDTNKWADIGYNFLVGQDGNVYEGRGWNYVGAHAKQWNPVSMGIAVIGSFKSSVPNSAAQNALKQLISCGVRMGKLSRYYTLHGHRDGVCTDCPGQAFYNLIKTWPRYGGKLPGGC